MIKQLFQAKVLGTLVFAILMIGMAASVNEVKAQSQDDEVVSPKLNPSELAEFDNEYNLLVEEIEETTSYTEGEKAIRLHFIGIVHERVHTGYGIEDAINSAVEPTRIYAERIKDGNQVNFFHIVEQAKQRFL